MAFDLQAPAAAPTARTRLPSPEFSDSYALSATINLIRAIDGTPYTYVKKKAGRRKCIWQFKLSRAKFQELYEFVRLFHSNEIRVTDHAGRVWVGFITSNPVQWESTGRYAPGQAGFEETVGTCSIEFEGFQQ